MTVLLHFFILLLAYTACVLLNGNGAYTTSMKKKVLSSVIHLAAISLTISLYGNMRGLFVYIGLIALFGIAFIFFSNILRARK